MKRKLFWILSAAFFCFFGLSVCGKETVLYKNDFSSADLSAFTQKGGFTVKDGKLYTTSGSGPSAFLSYTFPASVQGKDYRVDVDYLGHTGMGGILIGATGKKLTASPSYFSGYTCTTTTNGQYTYIAYFNETGWGGSFAPGTNKIEFSDIHLSVTVQKGVMTFRTTSLDRKTEIQTFRYEIGDHENDLYDTFLSTVGLRKYYNDSGCFDNFVITLLEDDELPIMTEHLKFGDTVFSSSGLTTDGELLTGNGAALFESTLSGNYRLTCDVASHDITRLYFGMKDEKNGYAFELNEAEKAVFLYSIRNGIYTCLGEKENILRNSFCDLTLDVTDGIVALYYDNLYEGAAAFPKFEFPIADANGKFGFWLSGGQIAKLKLGDGANIKPDETYLNPVCPGADPDMLYYDGTYYLYVYAGNDGTNIFRVYTSPDLVHFTPRNIVFKWDHEQYANVNGKSAWSPNVFYYDGLFYLFFAANPAGNDSVRHVYYATSDSPYGPFKHDGPLVAINPDVNEIDGHPFLDDDGRIYMSFSRYDQGGTIWLEEVKMKNGVVTALPETATRVIISDREWDNDGATRLCEGGFVFKHDGLYYMIYATVSYARHYSEAFAVAEHPLGPYKKYDYNPFLIHNYMLDGPGDALVIPSPDKTELYLVYHRHFAVGTVHPRQTCVDLIKFVPDPDGGPDILTVRGPSSTPQPLPSNRGRYDINRDGQVTLADALKALRVWVSGGTYSGIYDTDANGSVGLHDVVCILKNLLN